MDTISGFSGKSYEKIVQKKDPGNRENGVHGARTTRNRYQERMNDEQDKQIGELKNDRNR
jgi:hypothetical protein